MTRQPHSSSLPWQLTLAAALLICLPVLVFDYLPCTDLPQHLSVASILRGLDDPATGFARYYTVDLGRTMYLLPYGLTLALGAVLPLELAQACVIFLSLVLYPVALMALLRALGKPRALSLLGLPLVYNSAFFWGFINFNLSVGLAIWGMALLLDPRRGWRGDIGLGLLGGLVVFTHLYGLLLLLGFALLLLVGRHGRSLIRQLVPLAPALVGVIFWPWPGQVNPEQVASWKGVAARLLVLPREVFGAYQDRSEILFMALLLGGFLVLGWRAIPLSLQRWRACPWPERAVWLLLLINLLLYQVMPLHTATAKFVHFRHGLIAAMLLPALLPTKVFLRRPNMARAVLVGVAAASLLGAWWHLHRFNAEAREFDQVLRELPRRPRLLSLIFDPRGQVMATAPYLHFAGHVQARKGGLISTTFARFWNIPVRHRPGLGAPETPDSFEWQPLTYRYHQFGYYYPWVLARLKPGARLPDLGLFPYVEVMREGSWRLYRKEGKLLKKTGEWRTGNGEPGTER